MNGRSTGWKNYLPTLVILALLAIAFVVSLKSDASAQPGIPAITGFRYVILMVVGLAAGFLGGIIGTGGCSVMLPAIHFWLGYLPTVAVGTTLFAVIFTALSGGYAHLVRRNLNIRATLWLGLSGIVGVLLGSYLFTLLSSQTKLLGLLLGLAFVWPAVRMIGDGFFTRHRKTEREGNEISGSSSGLAAFGFVIGTLTGVVGLGGGYALVPGLIYLFGAPVYVTMGTSLATMIPLAVVGGSIKLAQGFVAINAGLVLAAGTVIGAQIGAAAIKRFKPNTLKLIFGLYFAYVSIKFIAGYFEIHVW